MPDVPVVRPQDAGSNTLLHVAEHVGELRLPAFEALGLGNILPIPGIREVGGAALAAWGRCALRHHGADTYAGHQEIAGSAPGTPVAQRMAEVGDRVAAELRAAGHRVEPALPGHPPLLVDGGMVVADNLEGESAQNINVTASLDEFAFEEICAVASVLRSSVRVGRVIAVAGRGFGRREILARIEARGGLVGVNTPALGVYDEHYRVRHLVLGARLEGQAPTIVRRAGLPVTLIGKAADVIVCDGATGLPAVDTDLVLDLLERRLASQPDGLIFANVQETDLAGHEQDAPRYAALLRQVDARLLRVREALVPGDLLLITGDHGNDPTVGDKHTREYTPLLAYGPGVRPTFLGERATLADVGATAVAALGLAPTESGTSVLPGDGSEC